MRDYAKIVPTFWTGNTGKALRKSPEGALVALYLLSSPHSNMLGLYYQPVLYMAHETGLGFEGAWKGLRQCIEVGFCCYDEGSEMVWVKEMAAYQIGEALKPADKRCAGIQKDYDALPDNPFLGAFFDRYSESFHLTQRRAVSAVSEPALTVQVEAPSKPHRSQEQEQEQEKEQDQEKKIRAETRKSKSSESPKAASTITAADLQALGVEPQVAADFLALRAKKRAPVTATALAGLEREADAAGMTLNAALRTSVERGWQGFKAEWIRNEGGRLSSLNGHPAMSESERRKQEFLRLAGQGGNDSRTIDMEPI